MKVLRSQPYPQKNMSSDPEIHFRRNPNLYLSIRFEQYRALLLKWWWIPLIAIVIAIGSWIHWARTEPDIFQAKASMLIAPKISVPGIEVYTEERSNFYGTQVRLMQSRQVLEAVQKRLQPLEKSLGKDPKVKVQISREKDASIFNLSVMSTSPEYAKAYLEALIEEFMAYKKRIRTETSQSAASTLIREIEHIDGERIKAETELFKFQKENNMTHFEGQNDIATQYLVQLQGRLADVSTDMDFFNAGTMEKLLVDSPNFMLERKMMDVAAKNNSSQKTTDVSLEDSLEILKEKRKALSKVFQDAHPKMIALDEDIQIKQKLVSMAKDRAGRESDAYFVSLLKQQQVYQSNFEKWEKRVLENNRKSAEYALLKSNVSRTHDLYDVLIKRLKEIDLSNSMGQEEMAINEVAVVSANPIFPDRFKGLLLRLAAALFVSGCLIGILKQFDDRIKSIDDIRDLFPDPILGQIPLLPGVKGPILFSHAEPHNGFAESFRNVRSSLMFSPFSGRAKTIAVTSTAPGDGKTTCAVNLAIALSKTDGGKTLLIDGDLRKMTVHKYFNLPNKLGLSEILKGYAALGDCLVESGIENLHFLPAGAVAENSSELLIGENFRDLLRSVSDAYHHIIIDTTPVLATDDALSLSPLVDGVVFVVKSDHTSTKMLHESLALLKQRGSRVFGLILNQVSPRSSYYHHNYYAHYAPMVSSPKIVDIRKDEHHRQAV